MSSSLPAICRPTDCCATSCDDVVNSNVPGPAGADGAPGAAGTNGVNAYTTTTAGFTMPAVSGNVSVTVAVSSWASVGQVIYISNAGYFSVAAVPDATHITATNLGYTGNVAPTTVVGGSQTVSPAGIKGTDGAAGSATLDDLSPTTTKGDLIVDNGANSPSASDVRLAVGTDGQLLVSVSTQPTGLQYQTLLPVAATDNGIPRFNGASGTPIPLQTSNVVINDNGAIQASGSGGNARGTDAIDLQVNRSIATEVASGNSSVISGGTDNTASGVESTVCGGASNIASGIGSVVCGGGSNTASGANSSVCGGGSNTASNDNTFVGGGDTNSATANKSTVVGGELNLASGNNAAIVGGRSNLASGSYSGVVSGFEALANKWGQVAQSGGKISTAGDAQTSVLVARIQTTDGTANVEMFLDGSTQRLTLSDDTTWGFVIYIVARRTDANNESAVYEFKGGIDRNVGVATTALIAAVTKTVIAEDTAAWDCQVSADAANGSLKLDVTGEGGKTINWTARITLIEISG